MEGPRGLQKGELDSLRALTGDVFRPGLVDEYPQLFFDDNFENLRVCVDNGQCVSHVGMTQHEATLLGCGVKVCCIGAVSTLKEYRGQGLASATFDDAANKAYHDGVDLMIVSGDRNLYRMRGCLHVGRGVRFVLTQDLLPVVAQHQSVQVTAEIMSDAELPLVVDCYGGEPVRFIRPLEDYHYALQSHIIMGHPSDFIVIREQGEFRGYIILHRPRDNRCSQIVEFAGDRRAIFAALPDLFHRYNLLELRWQVQQHDDFFYSLCRAAGLQPTPAVTSGTVKLINFPQLMERMRPRFQELLGRRDAAQLSFWQRGDEYGFRFGTEELIVDRDTATRMLFGTIEGTEGQAIEGHGNLTTMLQKMLPLPSLWYGLNYV